MNILGPTYSVISSTHFCGHVDGGFPARCWTVNFTGACEDQCTAFDSCIAYASDAKQCFIIPSTGSCPSGWKFENGHIAKQRIDLTTSDAAFYGCIAKGTTHQSFIIPKLMSKYNNILNSKTAVNRYYQ